MAAVADCSPIVDLKSTQHLDDHILNKRSLSDQDRSCSSISPPSAKKRKSVIFNSDTNYIDSPVGFTKQIDIRKISNNLTSVSEKASDFIHVKMNWDPRDVKQMLNVKTLLHLSTIPEVVVCRDEQHKKILEYCKICVEKEKSGSLYVCGCPGTGKSLSMYKIQNLLIEWANGVGFCPPDVITMNCSTISVTSEIFTKMLEKRPPCKEGKASFSPLKLLQDMYSSRQESSHLNMTLVIIDELDYLVTKDKTALHDLFMLTTLPFSRCILIGVANAIDLADRFLPRLKSMNCKPHVITFPAYSHVELLRILEQRLMTARGIVFHHRALELCARKIASACGDVRKALAVCRHAVEMLETELRAKNSCDDMEFTEAPAGFLPQESNIVTVGHMALALSRANKTPIVDIIQSLPQHQQIILWSAEKIFRESKKDATIEEMNKCYIDTCRLVLIPPMGFQEFLSMCGVLGEQGLLKLDQGRTNKKIRKVGLNIDTSDVTFALRGLRLFLPCLH